MSLPTTMAEVNAHNARVEAGRLKFKLKHENHDHNNAGLCPSAYEPTERMPLDDACEAKEAHWYDAATRFEITFTVYSRRPGDWDGYSIKALQDFCVTAGIIPDDRWDIVSGRVVSRKAATEGEEKTVIEIKTL